MKPALKTMLALSCLAQSFLVCACDEGDVVSSPSALMVSSESSEPTPSPSPAPSGDDSEDASSSCEPPAVLIEPTVISNPLPEYRVVREGCDKFQPPVVRFVVVADGKTRSVEIIRSTGCERSDRIILDYIRGWTYEPATCDGKPVAQVTLLTVRWGS